MRLRYFRKLSGFMVSPEIINTYQGSQFTADEFVAVVRERSCKLIMDGKSAWRDTIFIERLWRIVRYEEVYLHAYDSVAETRRSIRRYQGWYNQARPHSKLHKMTPNEAYAVMLPTVALEAKHRRKCHFNIRKSCLNKWSHLTLS